jgi:hypothetical protein
MLGSGRHYHDGNFREKLKLSGRRRIEKLERRPLKELTLDEILRCIEVKCAGHRKKLQQGAYRIG